MSVVRLSTVQGVDWDVAKPGMRLVTPTSIANSGGSASINSGGSVTFSGVTSLSLNGVFSALYDNYVIVTRATATVDNNMGMVLRASGTDATGANYTYQNILASGTSVTASRGTGGTGWILGTHGTPAVSGQTITIFGPFLAQPTAYRGVYVHSYLSALIDDSAGTHSLSTSYDGFTISMASGTTTGTVAVYGVSR